MSHVRLLYIKERYTERVGRWSKRIKRYSLLPIPLTADNILAAGIYLIRQSHSAAAMDYPSDRDQMGDRDGPVCQNVIAL